MRINVKNLVNDATRRAHATDPRAKQKQVSGWQAAELARQLFLGLARHNDADVCALMRRYRHARGRRTPTAGQILAAGLRNS